MVMTTPLPAAGAGRGTTITVLGAVLTPLALLTSFVRLYARARNRQLGLDDCCIAACIVPLVLGWVFGQLQVSAGFGQHTAQLTPPQVINILRYGFASQIIWISTLILPKTAIIFYILRIKDSRGMRAFLFPLGALLWLSNLAVFVVMLAQCRPISAFWTLQGDCWSPAVYRDTIYVSVGYSIISDLICAAMPTIVLWNVPLNRRLKFAICGLICIGLIATAAGIVRAIYTALLSNTKDLSFDLAGVAIWAMVEIQCAVIGANVAVGHYVFNFFRHGPRVRDAQRHVYAAHEGFDSWETDSQRLYRLNSVSAKHKKARTNNDFITIPDTLRLTQSSAEPGQFSIADDEEFGSSPHSCPFMAIRHSQKSSFSTG